ncbi:unnamed protein product [Rotaria sp. Silwood1]|nr:unnamed protein product [Rotaria sp. Silwood1]CAF3948010.1 unnamed protein product [Rotaria sp. Silwood1]CAF5024433.1 unnamed protein product [Rotaria sp. Silwood1]CAF5032323.1 unnamed protein product [Rotaria sp. Silwood1]CAF5130275.1 unnamed protein product [Rotaria sp. Silwood1]
MDRRKPHAAGSSGNEAKSKLVSVAPRNRPAIRSVSPEKPSVAANGHMGNRRRPSVNADKRSASNQSARKHEPARDPVVRHATSNRQPAKAASASRSDEIDQEQGTTFYGMNAKEKEIFKLINNHRQQNGLAPLQPSANLAYVAHTHAVDIIENSPDVNGGNMHSWSNRGHWKPVRYTSDHAQASLMWSKPSEISNYKFNGYEISHGYDHNARQSMTVEPRKAVDGWKQSPGHNGVIIQKGTFKNTPMKTMGVGVYKGYACVWFGEKLDTFPAPH